MSNTERKRVLNYRNDNGSAPNPDNIDYGEIAIGYKKDNEAIYIKNTANGIVDFTPISIVNITYNKLKNLRDNSKLKPSQYYRIIDFVTTVANDPEAQSAGHPFDIIVLASDKDRLQEECYAIQREDERDTYFDNCNLAAWKIWYCLDNDTTKYAWADTTKGKGVIYRMIDEWQNDCPYDFKNVQFKRYAVENVSSNGALANLAGTYIGYNSDMTGLNIPDQLNFKWAYTFSIGERTAEPGDASIIGYNSEDVGNGYGSKGYYGDNTIKPTSFRSLIDNVVYPVFCLNNIVWWTNNMLNRDAINGNRIESECFNMTLYGYGTIIEHDCRNFIMGSQCYGNSFKTGCSCNTFGNRCSGNTFGDDCRSNSFGNSCNGNSFGYDCCNNSFGYDCCNNSFGNGCTSNSFGNGCTSNSFGHYCYSNTFGSNCRNNSFGNGCYSNSFGNYFQYNALGNDIQDIEIPTEKIYHTQILNGTRGTQSNKLTLEFTPETTYSQFAGFTSDGVLKIWVEADDIVNITYNELKKLRDNSKLKPSQYYRITDFITTVANDDEARSAGHPFDIIVLASDKNKLQEECYAIQHEGDTYFANCNLAAWKIWYCLDNDTTKYAWADTTNGKGVIYRMIDEWQNDCPYDFKNVQFKRYWANGINTTKNVGESTNIILQGYYGIASTADIFTEGIDTNDSLFCFTFTRLNNILANYGKGSVNQSNVLDESIQTEGLNRCRNNILKPTETDLRVDTKEYMTLILLNNVFITVKADRYKSYQSPFDNTLGVSCVNNTFGNNCYGNSFGDDCVSNSFGDDCYSNTFGYDCGSNSFGNRCSGNTFGSNCKGNSFGNDCEGNSFGSNCGRNSFGSTCEGNSFGSDCGSNSFGSSCGSNSFGDACRNSFGDDCKGNSFGNDCYSNTFGYGCSSNSFGSDCCSNSFGHYCSSNSFGYYCYSNSFGKNCYSNTFGSGCSRNSFGNYFQYNALGNDIQDIEIPTEKIYHTQILNGTQSTSSNKLTLEFTPKTTYSQFAGFTSDGVLKIWVEADAPHDTVDGGSY